MRLEGLGLHQVFGNRCPYTIIGQLLWYNLPCWTQQPWTLCLLVLLRCQFAVGGSSYYQKPDTDPTPQYASEIKSFTHSMFSRGRINKTTKNFLIPHHPRTVRLYPSCQKSVSLVIQVDQLHFRTVPWWKTSRALLIAFAAPCEFASIIHPGLHRFFKQTQKVAVTTSRNLTGDTWCHFLVHHLPP